MASEPDSIEINEPTLLIRIPRAYQLGMSREALYEATRGHWRIGPRRECAELAMAVVGGTVLEVYVIDGWHPAGTTPVAAPVHGDAPPHRWEFTGRIAPESIRAKYVSRSVAGYFSRGYQTPFAYVNCP